MRGFPTRYIVFDTETQTTHHADKFRTEELRFQMGCLKYSELLPDLSWSEIYVEFDSTKDFHLFVKRLTKTNEKLWIFAHNAGFDLRIIEFFRFLTDGWYLLHDPARDVAKRGLDDPFVVLQNPPMMIRAFRPDGQSIFLSDTFQWITSSLKGIGLNLGFEKGIDPGQDAPFAERMAYCRQDVDVLDMALRRIWTWLKGQKIKAFHPTRAGQSRLIFTEKYEHQKIKYHDNADASAMDRHAYYGGRTDLWYVGEKEGPIYQLDINSLYPYVMKENWYPCELLESGREGMTMKRLIKERPRSFTAEVWLNTDDTPYPVRNREGTWFCKGKVRTILTGPELFEAVQSDHVVKIGRYNRYRLCMLFDQFVSDFWVMRKAAQDRKDKTQDTIVKLLMNSLYGKFGQQTGEWMFHDSGMPPEYYGEGIVAGMNTSEDVDWRCLGGHVFHRWGKHEAPKSFIAIASYVTSYARCLMDDWRYKAGQGNVYYQATDSLYCNQEAYDQVEGLGGIQPTVLGKFKNELTHNKLKFIGIHRLEREGEMLKLRGEGKNTKIGNGLFEVKMWESFQSGLFAGHISEVFIRTLTKKLSGKYRRQRILPDGSTEPWTIDNWEMTPEQQKDALVPVTSEHREQYKRVFKS